MRLLQNHRWCFISGNTNNKEKNRVHYRNISFETESASPLVLKIFQLRSVQTGTRAQIDQITINIFFLVSFYDPLLQSLIKDWTRLTNLYQQIVRSMATAHPNTEEVTSRVALPHLIWLPRVPFKVMLLISKGYNIRWIGLAEKAQS